MKTISIGAQNFADLRQKDLFYIDKTDFIREWWESEDPVTLITRPRRFGKTLNMQMLESFFSDRYAGRGDELFEGLEIWKDEKYRKLQGTYPVIFLSFADVKDENYEDARESIIGVLQDLFESFKNQWVGDPEEEKKRYSFMEVDEDSSNPAITRSVKRLSDYLYHRTGKKCLIFLDEYDTPLQEAYVHGYWDQMSSFMRSLFNSTFKTNSSMERAVLTGVTRVSKESLFSGLNNPDVSSVLSEKYETCFGFTESEVKASLLEYHLSDQFEEVRKWYDGFTFGNRTDIYNPWSIINFLDKRKFDTYWVNTSSNDMISDLIRTGSSDLQSAMETLLYGGMVNSEIDEEIIFTDLDINTEAVWSLMVAAGYLKVVDVEVSEDEYKPSIYTLRLTNGEVRRMYGKMIRRWFGRSNSSNNEFVKAMLAGDTVSMNEYMNRITEVSFSSFDVGDKPSETSTPERFYHGFVLGLLVREYSRYRIKSNRESGFGRYDICMFPLTKNLPGIVIEFKVLNENAGENKLSDTAEAALQQIEEKDYASDLREAGVTDILEYGFAFSGKKVLIKKK